MFKFFINICLLVLLLSISVSLQAQKIYKPFVSSTEVLPEWVTLMYATNPNVWQVDNARRDYYRNHPFQKTAHTQYYKRWRRAVARYIDEQGYAHRPTWQQLQIADQNFRQKRAEQQSTTSAQKQLSSQWECIGPFETFETPDAGGNQPAKSDQANIYCIDQALSNTNTLFCGTETGMIFKSTDKALHWSSVSHDLTLGGVTAIKIHPTNPNIVFAGDGNHLIKTIDGGNTWATALDNVEVNDIAISPANAQIVMVATQQGFYRSTNGGSNFTSIYTQASYDIEFKPNDAATVYLVKNNPTQNRCEFFKSANSGASFTIQSTGWFAGTDPNRQDGGARLSVTPANPNRVYAILIGQAQNGDNGFIGVYKSNDAGATWTLPNAPAGGPYNAATHPCLTSFSPDAGPDSYHQGFYNLAIGASHNNADVLYIGCLNSWRSTDGGATFEWLGGYGGILSIHPDVQDIKIFGNDIWFSTDGGVDYSNNEMSSNTAFNNGLYASDYWGFGSGWNNDVLAGGRYHNGNAVFYESYPLGKFVALGGGEAATGYVNPGENRRVYHSDIGGTVIGETFSAPIDWFGVGRFPNESYYAAESSEMEFDPLCYNSWYLGQDNNIWRTTDGGINFELVYAFGSNANNQVKQIEISRSNPGVMYVFQQPASGSLGKLWKTTNGGTTWAQTTLPTGNSRVCTISLSATNANTLWLGFTYGSNGNKVFKTTDGGDTWSNLTTSLFDGEDIHSILHQGGTNGGVYVGTQHAVYYRNNTLSWVLYANALPTVIATDQLRPFYKNNKIRMASYGKGIWQADLYEASTPVAQPMANKLISYCPSDSIQFEDYSILDHTGATWLWQFEGGSPATSTLRNPIVNYSAAGTYDVTLSVANANGSNTKTVANMITIAPNATNNLPVSENFEGALTLTPINPDEAIGWASTPSNCAANGSTAYFVNCYNYSDGGQTDDLLFPENLNLGSVQGARLTFNYAYAPYIDAGGAWTDTLRVLVSNNCGRTFTAVFEAGGEDLSTTSTGSGPNNNYESSDWYPESCADWQQACINLSQYAGQILQVKIQSQTGYGNNIFVDNVLLESNALLAPTITGNAASCIGQQQSYSAPAGGSQYIWTVSNGQIVSGQGTATIEVQWNSGVTGSVSVNIVP